jgi:hypothetical protein
MTSAIRTTVIAVALLLSIGISRQFVSAQPDYTAIEKKIKDTYAEITKAAEKVDAEKLFSYVLDNDKGALVRGGRITLTRQEALDSYKERSQSLKSINYKIDRQYVTVISPQTALLVAEGSYEATTTEGKTFGLPFAQTVVFVLKDNQWKVLHSHTSSPAAGQ